MRKYTRGQLELAQLIYGDYINSDEVGFLDKIQDVINSSDFIYKPDVLSVLNITGRGLVFVVDDYEEYKVGDQVKYQYELYTITAVECMMKGNRVSPNKGLVVKLNEDQE